MATEDRRQKKKKEEINMQQRFLDANCTLSPGFLDSVLNLFLILGIYFHPIKTGS